MSEYRGHRALSRFAGLTAVATLGLITLGGLVTSHGVGLAVPDWPNTYGYNMFFFPISQWVGGILYEHSHRLWGSVVGMLTSILALWVYGRKARRFMRWLGLALFIAGGLAVVVAPGRWQDALVLGLSGLAMFVAQFFWPRAEPGPVWLRRLGLIAFFAVVLQGILGGLRVTQLKDEIGIFHGTLAQCFFVLTVCIALFTSRWWNRLRESLGDVLDLQLPGTMRSMFFGTTLLIFCQLMLGATMRHQHAGLAIPDFPLAYGKAWPATDPASVERYNQQRLEITSQKPITAAHIHLQMTHRIVALAIFSGTALCAWRTVRRFGLKNLWSRWSLAWFGIILAQVILGMATIWSRKAADIATAHVIFGALSLATGTFLCILSVQVTAALKNPNRRMAPADGLLPSPAGSS